MKDENFKGQVDSLRKQGIGYRKIAKILNCSRSKVVYYCYSPEKRKQVNELSWKCTKKKHPIARKIQLFLRPRQKFKQINNSKGNIRKIIYRKIRSFHLSNKKETTMNNCTITVEDVLDKIGPNPKCYLTGTPIDITKSNTYQFDHIIPASRGGQNVLDNLAIVTKQANRAKGNNTNEEFFILCKQILEYNGYKVDKINEHDD